MAVYWMVRLRRKQRVPHGHCSGGRESPTWQSWQSMLQRCDNPKHKAYADYGGRGIRVTPRWRRFIWFLDDMDERPEGTTLDRIDVESGYRPGNCRWATPEEQRANRRDTKKDG